MKKLILLSFLTLLISCENDQQQTINDHTNETYKNNPEESYRPREAKIVDKFIFEGHRYIMFRDDYVGSYKGLAGVVHDPNCECFKKDE